ncbi:hypothetical protein [Nonomuraea phyllanthi]|uniref:hypothetical protein n=1 Tax=Nonomuraea phyllanthi TaxID=2219224 RepID=UPI001292F041|nr:hypothetical protein [Nonomuraea phyllanthi]
MKYPLQYVVVTAKGYRAVAVRKRISVPPLGKQEEPAGLKALKQEIPPPLGRDRPVGRA